MRCTLIFRDYPRNLETAFAKQDFLDLGAQDVLLDTEIIQCAIFARAMLLAQLTLIVKAIVSARYENKN